MTSVDPTPPTLNRPPHPHFYGVVLAILAATGFACKGIFIKFAYRHGIDGETLLMLRMVTASALFAGAMAFRRLRTPHAPVQGTPSRDTLALLGLGFLGYYLSSLLDFKGLERLPASVERLILMLYPTFTVILTAVVLRKRHPLAVWFALPICYGGMVLVLGRTDGGPVDLVGVLLVVGSTLSYALYMVLSPAVIARMGSMVFSEKVYIASTGLMAIHYAVSHGLVQPRMGDLARFDPAVWFWVALLSVFSTVVPLYALSAAVARIGAARTAVLGMGGPVLTIAMGVVFLGESFGWVQMVGAALVLGGVALAGRK